MKETKRAIMLENNVSKIFWREEERFFLAYASKKTFKVFLMDAKSSFLNE